MNLLEFLNYRKNCLCCGAELKLSFHSKKKQIHTYSDNRLLVKMSLDSLKKFEKAYKVGYSIDFTTNDFCIEFYDKLGTPVFENEVPTYLINRFKQLNTNHGSYKIYKHCTACNKYNYTSNYLSLDYKVCNLGELGIESEYAIFHKPIEDGYKGYRLISWYNKNESWFEGFKIPNSYWKFFQNSDVDPVSNNELIKTSLIPFGSNPNDMMDKLSTLLTFS